ncbi:MAG: FAD-dependent oxidoreductase [Thermodesulfobacteriota bacterium]
MTAVRKHTIIGNSAAGLSAIKAIRSSGDTRPIVLISAERTNAYSPVLTTYYIGGQIPREGLFLVTDDFYRRHRVERVFGRTVLEVDPDRRRLFLSDRKRVDYEDLLLATGASARTLEGVEPAARPRVFTLRTLEDAVRIKEACRAAREIVVTGAGLVSLQTIKAVLGRGLGITNVVGSFQVLSQQMDPDGARFIQEKLEAEGVEILFGREVERVAAEGDRVRVVTSYGESLPADLVIVGKGVRPNIDPVRGRSIRTNRGILVDERMRTNVEDVYAAGDVAEGFNQLTGEREVIATWLNACAQGEIAGLNMAGRPARRTGQFRENVTTILGAVVASIGESRPEYGRYQEVFRIDHRRGRLRKLFFDGPYLVGALLIGWTSDAGVIRHCIAGRVDLSRWKDRIAVSPLEFGCILYGQGLDWTGFPQQPHFG